MTYEVVPIGTVKAASDNVRHEVGDVTELAASIKAGGVLQPLLVDAGMVLVAGARRLAAAKKAGLKEVPVVKREFSPQERLEAMIVENLQREDLSPIEEAGAFSRLVGLGLTQRKIAERVGRSQAHVQKRLSLLTLPETVQQQVESGGITLPDAQELAKIKDDPTLVVKLAKDAKSGAYGPSISSKVEQEMTKRENEKKRQDVADGLRAKGVPVIDVETDTYGYRVTLPEGVKEVRAEAFTAEFVEMKPAEHAKLECHAVYVQPRQFVAVEVCTSPESHPSKADALKEERQKEAARRAKAKEEFDSMTERRRSFVRDLVKARADKDSLLELAYFALVSGDRWYYGADDDELTLAADLLGLEPAEGDDDREWKDLFDLEAAKSAAARMRVTLALCAAKFEVGLNRDTGWDTDSPWFAWLAGRGYELSSYEKHLLDKNGKELAA